MPDINSPNKRLVLLNSILQVAFIYEAEKNFDVMLPGCTHLQVAQPTTFGHHLMAYFEKWTGLSKHQIAKILEEIK